MRCLEQQKRESEPDTDAEDFSLILNVESAPGYPLKLDSLERLPTKKEDGIYLLNVRKTIKPQGEITSAAILVPFGRLRILQRKVADYADPQKDSEKKDCSVPR